MKRAFLTIALLAALPAAANPLRIGVLTGYSVEDLKVLNARGAFRVSTAGTESVFAKGKAVEVKAVGNQVSVRFREHEVLRGSQVKLSDATIDTPGLPWRRYPGDLLLTAKEGKLALVNEVELEDYLSCVLASETERGWPLEALKAQAVVSRTYALNARHGESYDLCDLTHCQVYHGLDTRNPLIERAIQETSGLILTYQNHPAQALFHSTCGGNRAANQWIFGGAALPYLKAGPDTEKGVALCRESPHSSWKVAFTAEELSKALKGTEADVGKLRQLRIERAGTGFVQQVFLKGDTARTVSGYTFWLLLGKSLGWGEVQSLNFSLAREGDRYLFSGKGLGHGVGLCQWGARKLALMGQSYRAILMHYFPGTSLQPSTRVSR